mgnify:CR=1 FL=1
MLQFRQGKGAAARAGLVNLPARRAMSAPAPSFIIVTDPGPDPDDVMCAWQQYTNSWAYAANARDANGPGDAHDCRRIAARRIAGLPNH